MYINPPPPTPPLPILLARHVGGRRVAESLPPSSLLLMSSYLSSHELAGNQTQLTQTSRRESASALAASAADAGWLVGPWFLPGFVSVVDLRGNGDPRECWECLQPAAMLAAAGREAMQVCVSHDRSLLLSLSVDHWKNLEKQRW